eukprot:2384605-Prymnesium_polylepis.1
MQHESLISTTANEGTHRLLAAYSGRGHSTMLATGSMIAGDYAHSRAAAIRHQLVSCGADVPHDELQLAAFSNKLAGFDRTGSASPAFAQLLPARAYDYDLPRAASSSFLLVKNLPAGN